jgi:protein-tyrosine phosphatase
MQRILFVCLGNICRSPLAEGILRRQAQEAGIELEIDSAGTGDWHVGQLPDRRSIQVGQANGCDMTMRARQVRSQDFRDFDLIVAMDYANVSDLEGWRGSDPGKVRLARSFDAQAATAEVPDPYYGEYEDFIEVHAMLESACRGILNELSTRGNHEPNIVA